jgi:hypothetical protein
MAKTPDRSPGVSDEEGIILSNEGVLATVVGEIRYNGSRFSLKDVTGEYDPRSGGGGISEVQHNALRQLIHFINDGPTDGFASGSFKESEAVVFPTYEIWWESSSKLKKIVSLDTTWTGPKITGEVWKIYDTDGSTVLVTVTDAIAYSGIFEASRTRTWA